MPVTTGIQHVALLTEDLDRFIDFYSTVFEAEATWVLTEEGVQHAFVDMGGGFYLHPFQIPDAPDDARGKDEFFQRGHIDHLAIAVDEEETFQVLRKRLVEAGASDGMLVDFGTVRSVWFTDPDGMGSEIVIEADGEIRSLKDAIRIEYLS